MAPNFALPSISIILVTSTLILMPIVTHSLPFVLFYGFLDSCTNKKYSQITDLLSNWSNSQGYCIEIGNGVWDSVFMPFSKQIEIACEKVKKISVLNDGYNMVGFSQGNLVGRGVIEFCDGGPPVKNFISLAGPHAGIASVPYCGVLQPGFLCVLADSILKNEIYCDYVQEHFAPANYIKIPTDIDEYREGCEFLPRLNNEFNKKSTYKERFASLQNLVLIMFDQDTVLVPKETSWFGYYPEGSWSTVLPAQETQLYIEDWIGLKTLNEAGKVKYINVSGDHADIAYNDMKKYIVPYLEEETSKKPVIVKSSHLWSSSVRRVLQGKRKIFN